MSEVLPVDPTITIRAETSQADPDTCKFTVSRTVHPGGPFFFDSKDRASGSPLVERLFAWMMRSRRLVTRYEHHAPNFLGFVQLACATILLRRL